MVRPLFRSMSELLKDDFEKGIFAPFRFGWILPTVDLLPGQTIFLGQTFLSSFLSGRFVYLEESQDPCGYYFASQFKTTTTGTFLLAYSACKAGMVKESNKILSNDNLVIIEYPNCGTLALNPQVNESIKYIFEGQ